MPLAPSPRLHYDLFVVHRSLRFQLILSVVLTVVCGLGASQWLGTHLSERALEQDLGHRELLLVKAVGTLWQQTSRQRLSRDLKTLIEGQRPIRAIDVFRLRNGRWEPVATTRGAAQARELRLAPHQAAQLRANLTTRTPLPGVPEGTAWSLLAPLRGESGTAGAVQVEVHPVAFGQLKKWLRVVDGLGLASSIAVISLALALVLERGVNRPLANLVNGMRRAESGDLAVRLTTARAGEFSFLARGFNSMLARLQDLTTGLETRVERATQELAAKNVELQVANARLSEIQLEAGRTERLAAHGQMAAAIAHELGTPLNSVLGYTQLLLREEGIPERADKLAIIESQVQRMADTIRSMLDQARIQAVHRASVVIAPLVQEALALLSPRLASRDLVVQQDIATDLPPIPADPTGIRQVLINLLTNAIDATQPPGTVTIGARVGRNDGTHGPHVELTVRDTGQGMTPEELRRACEPFYTTKVPGHGTGLGLVIVDHIVRAHQGRLVIESTPTKGTTVRVQLPLES